MHSTHTNQATLTRHTLCVAGPWTLAVVHASDAAVQAPIRALRASVVLLFVGRGLLRSGSPGSMLITPLLSLHRRFLLQQLLKPPQIALSSSSLRSLNSCTDLVPDARLCLCWSLQVSGIPAGVSAEEVEALLTGPGGIVVDRLDITTPEGPANRERMQVGALLEQPECLMPCALGHSL